MSRAFTRGPWDADEGAIVDGGSHVLALVMPPRRGGTFSAHEAAANADLMAAAPELVDAVAALLVEFGDCVTTPHQRAAIADARRVLARAGVRDV